VLGGEPDDRERSRAVSRGDLAAGSGDLRADVRAVLRAAAAPHAGLERQALVGDVAFAGSACGSSRRITNANQSSSREEVEIVRELVRALIEGGIRWRDREAQEHPLGLDDILVIAPYNAQVADLIAAPCPPERGSARSTDSRGRRRRS